MAGADDAGEPPAAASCRGELHLDTPPDPKRLALLVGLAVAAGVGGFYIVWPAASLSAFAGPTHRVHRLILAEWALASGGLIGYGAAAAAFMCFGLYRLRHLFAQRRHLTNGLAGWGAIALVILAAVVLPTIFFTSGVLHEVRFEHRVLALTVLSVVMGWPGLTEFLALRSLAMHDVNWKESYACQVALLVRVRRSAKRVLGILGIFLTLIVVTSSSYREAVGALHGTTDPYPEVFVVLYGLLLAGLLALFHVTTSMAIDGRVERLLRIVAPLPDPRAEHFTAMFDKRQALSQVLDYGGSWASSFQSGVIVLAPLITALLGLAIPGK